MLPGQTYILLPRIIWGGGVVLYFEMEFSLCDQVGFKLVGIPLSLPHGGWDYRHAPQFHL